MHNLDTAELLVPNDKIKALICGLPHSLTYFAADACRRLLHSEFGQCNLVALNNLSAETVHEIRTLEGPVLFWADIPDQNVIRFADQSTFPVIAVWTDFQEACTEYSRTRSVGLADTIRTLALSKIGLWHMSELDRAHVIESRDIILQLSHHFSKVLHLKKPIQEIDSFLRNFDISAYAQSNKEISENRKNINDQFARVPAGISEFYGKSHLKDAHHLSIPPEIFNQGSPPYLQPSEQIDLVGPARCLTFGPFLYLPAGDWEVHFAFEATQNATTNSFTFDVLVDGQIKNKGVISIEKDGIYKYQINFNISNPWEPVEFRTFLEKGSIEGRFYFKFCEVIHH